MNILIANGFSFLGHIIDAVVGYKYNEKPKILLFNIISSCCSLLAMILLHSMAGCVSVIVTVFRLCVIYFKDKYHWKIDWAVLVFIAGYACIFLDSDFPVAVLMFTGNLVSFLPKWFCQQVQYLRIGAFLANFIFIFPHYLIDNFATIPFHIMNMVMILIAYIKWYRIENSLPRS